MVKKKKGASKFVPNCILERDGAGCSSSYDPQTIPTSGSCYEIHRQASNEDSIKLRRFPSSIKYHPPPHLSTLDCRTIFVSLQERDGSFKARESSCLSSYPKGR